MKKFIVGRSVRHKRKICRIIEVWPDGLVTLKNIITYEENYAYIEELEELIFPDYVRAVTAPQP